MRARRSGAHTLRAAVDARAEHLPYLIVDAELAADRAVPFSDGPWSCMLLTPLAPHAAHALRHRYQLMQGRLGLLTEGENA